jgi:hypothetical protein
MIVLALRIGRGVDLESSANAIASFPGAALSANLRVADLAPEGRVAVGETVVRCERLEERLGRTGWQAEVQDESAGRLFHASGAV